MTTFNQHFILVQCPTNAQEAQRLSIEMTQKMGQMGWQLVSVQAITSGGGTQGLLLAFQK